MGKDHGGKGGAILNVASILGLDSAACCPVYCGTKHAIIGLTKSYSVSELLLKYFKNIFLKRIFCSCHFIMKKLEFGC